MATKSNVHCSAAVQETAAKARTAVLGGSKILYYLLKIPHQTRGGKKTEKEVAYRSCVKSATTKSCFCADHTRKSKKGAVLSLDDVKKKGGVCLNPVKNKRVEKKDEGLLSVQQPLQLKVKKEHITEWRKFLDPPMKKKVTRKKAAKVVAQESESESSESESESSESESESGSGSSSESGSESESEESGSGESSSEESSSEESESESEVEDEPISIFSIVDPNLEESKKPQWSKFDTTGLPASLDACKRIYATGASMPMYHHPPTQLVIAPACEDAYDLQKAAGYAIGRLLPVIYEDAPIIYDGQFCAVTKPHKYKGVFLQRCVLSGQLFCLTKTARWVNVGKYDKDSHEVIEHTLNA
jgi:hypothetical protein